MPRQAHGRPVQPGPAKVVNKRKSKRGALNALELAEKQNPDSVKIRQNRLGVIEDDSDDPVSRADVDERSGKRRKITDTRADLEDEEIGGGASGSDDEGGRWHEGIEGSDEDSDIDSEEAFGESDEERFAHFTFRGSESMKDSSATKKQSIAKVKQQARRSQLDESGEADEWQDASAFNDDDEYEEDSSLEGEEKLEDDEDDLGDEAVDLATALEMNMEEEREEAERAARRLNGKVAKRRHETPESEDEDEDVGEDGSDTEDDQISQLSVSDDERQGDHQSLQQFIAGLTPRESTTKARSEFKAKALPDKPSSFGLSTSKLSAADLMQYVKDPAQRQSLKMLQASERDGDEDYKSGIPGKLSAPLAKRQQDKLDRAAAYDKSKETMNRWIDTVKQNRRAEHLSFPLFDNAENSVKTSRALAPTSQSAPATELEATIQTLMQESGLGGSRGEDLEEQEAAYEELEEKNVPLAEARARRAQLRLARDLLFREEIRAKRIKKIKSKAYRRVHRKERDRAEAERRELLAAAGLMNSDEEREKSDRRRAEERMGARHRESKWAKAVKQTGRAAWDDDARVGVSDLARRDEELRRRIEGKAVAGSDASESDSESDEVDTDIEDQRLAEKLDRLAAPETASSTKLGSMAFMQRAEAARKAENDEELRRLRHAMANGDPHDSESDGEQTTDGRQRYGVRPPDVAVRNTITVNKNEFEAPLSEDEREIDEQVTPSGLIERPSQEPTRGHTTTVKSREGSSARSRRQSSVPRNAAVALTARNPDSLAQPMEDYTSPSGSEDEAPTPPTGDSARAELAAAIFAGDDEAVRDFAREKKDTEAEEGDQVVDNTLPGWGSWAGEGISKREQKKGKGRFLTTIKGVDPARRQDARLERVIINEKRVKKNGKYLATELPHPFETRQQYERSLRLPMGPEWSTANHYQEAIKPRVLVKQGTVIKPMAKPRT